MTRRTAVALALAVAVLAAAGCAHGDGRTIAPPAPGATAPTTTDPAKFEGGSTLPLFTLASPVLVDGQPLPMFTTCDGGGQPPVLSWVNPPTATELALVVVDEDAGGVVHWVVSGLPVADSQLDPAAIPSGAVDLGYQPPCPPPGDPAHRYVFTLYAVTGPLGIVPGTPLAEAAVRIQASPAQVAQLTTSYQR